MPGFRVRDYTHLLKCSCKVTVTLIHRHAQSSKQLELPSTRVRLSFSKATLCLVIPAFVL